MGLFDFVKKGIKTVTGVASFLPGPIGTVAGVANRALKGRSIRVPQVNVQSPGITGVGSQVPGAVPARLVGGDPLGTGRTDAQRLRDLGGVVFGGAPTKIRSGMNLAGDAFSLLRGGNAAMTFDGNTSLATLKDMPIIVQPQTKTINSAPPGYVLVTRNGVTGAVLKPVARSMGLWKPRKKPPISVSEYTALQKANRAENKIKKLAQKADFVVRKSKR